MPWLERIPADGALPEQIPLASFPFTIGRTDSADLTVPSNRVSREHALILRENDGYRIRDLGSTNGTYVNGQRIEEALLEDGDLVVVADVELTFFTGSDGSADGNATQRIDSCPNPREREGVAAGIVREVRRLQETLVNGAVENPFQTVVELDRGEVFAYEAMGEGHPREANDSEARRLILATECRLSSRTRRLRRTLAAEEIAALGGESGLLVKLDVSEIGAAGLAESLGRLRQILSVPRPLVVEVPDGAVSDTPYFRELCEDLRAMAMTVAHGGFAGGAIQFAHRKEIAPDLLKLAPLLLRGIDGSRERQRQLQSLVRAASDAGCEVIATGIQNEQDRTACRRLGCRFGQGGLYGHPQLLKELVP